MAQAKQIIFATPSNDWACIDNSAAGATVTSNGTPPNSNNWTGIGFDITVPGSLSQGTNPFGDTGTVLLDSVNDTAYLDPNTSTVVGSPVAGLSPTAKVLTTVINNATTGIRILYKNPAVVLFSLFAGASLIGLC